MKAFGRPEIEMINTQRSTEDIRSILIDCAEYILLHNKKWKDNDKIPSQDSNSGKIPICIMKSYYDNEQVVRLQAT